MIIPLFNFFKRVSSRSLAVKLQYCLICLLLITGGTKAQVATYYIFSQSSGTYTPGLSALATPADVFVTAWDDATTIYSLPFDFTYNGILYTTATGKIGVDSDGWITFSNGNPVMTGTLSGGSWVSSSDQTGAYLNGTANNNGFAGFNCDLNEQVFANITGTLTNGSPTITGVSSVANIVIGTRLTGTGITNGTVVTAFTATTITMSAVAIAGGSQTITPRSSIYAFTSGVAPNRQFVIQWTQVKRYSSTGENINFQLILNEGNANPGLQTLQSIYGTCTATSATALETQVGLRGASTADFNARKSTSNWSATTAAIANTDLVRFNNTINPPSGLTFTWSPCTMPPGAAGIISGPSPVCPNTSQVYSTTVVAGATFYTWTYSGTGVTFTASTGTPSNTFNFSSGATGGNITVTAANICGSGTVSPALPVTVTSVTPATISYPAASYCANTAGPIAATLTGPGGGTFSVSPAGLTIVPATGAITPAGSTSGIYTVTYTYSSNGCTVTATTTVSIVPLPTVTATATPSAVCVNTNSQLLANVTSAGNYSVVNIPYSSLAASGAPVVLWSTTYTDDANSAAIPMPFAFTFYGAAITQFYVNSNGHIQLQTGVTPANTEQTLPNATTPNSVIALAWDDLIIDNSSNPGTYVRYFTNGTTPNRILVVEYYNLRFLGGSGQNITGQIRLYENDNHIEVAAGTVNDNGTARTKTLGIENSTGTLGAAPAGRNNVVWNVNNEAWAFYPITGTHTYLWSPATYLSSTNISNPVSTPTAAGTTNYTVSVTNSVTGCTATAAVAVTASAPLNGTYTVGAAGNYPTLTAAVNAYNSLCISGPVIFSLIDNTYPSETFPIVINSNIYASTTNTLTIKPALAKTPVITGSSTVAIIKFNGADYVAIDGSNTVGGNSRNLSIINTSTDAFTSTIIWLNSVNASNGATNNTIKNCNITGNSPTTTFTALISSGTAVGSVAETANSNNTYQNNAFIRCQTAIAIVGPSGNETGNIITGNTIGSVTAGDKLGWSGIEVYQQANCQVTTNIIFGITVDDFIVTSGISVYGGASGITISGNKISDIKNTDSFLGWGANGIYLGSSTTAANVNVFNNFISDIAAYGYNGSRYPEDNGYGIVVEYGGGYNIYHNTILLNTNQTISGFPACLNVVSTVTTPGGINVKNNIFTNTQTNSGQRYAIESTAASNVFGTIDYNCYNTAGANLGYIVSNRAALANIQAGFGQNGSSIQPATAPVYISATDLHINAANATNIANLDNKGNPAGGITSDYDTQTRNGLTPDLGADEWVRPNYGSWVGKTSTDWLVATNWEANYVPDLTTDVFVTGGYTFMPTIITTQAIRALSLSAPGTPPLITINAGTLQVYGTITRTGGTIDGSNGTVEMKGTAAQTIPAGLFQTNNLKNLIISNTDNVTGVTLGGTLDIYRSVTFGAGGRKLTTGNFLSFKSTASETAWLGQMLGTNTISGNATVERYIPNHAKKWQFLAVPTTGQTVNAAWQEGNTPSSNAINPAYGTIITNNTAGTGFDIIGGVGPSMKTYQAATNNWIGIANTTIPIANPKGYMLFVRGNRSVITIGAAPTSANLRTTGTLFTPASVPPVINIGSTQFESVGNPYASAIDFSNDVGVAKSVNVQKIFYVWDPKLGTGFGAYQTFTRGALADNNYYVSPGGGSYGAGGSVNTTIQSGQAFFVHTVGGTGTITITETAKVNGSNNVNRVPVNPGKQLRTNLYVTMGTDKVLVDGNLVEYDRSFSNGIDKLDALKLNNTDESLGLLSHGKTLAVERRSHIQRTDTVFYKIGQLLKMEYEFEFTANRLQEPGLGAWLEDNYLHTSRRVGLNDITRLKFLVNNDEGSYAPNRFRLVFIQQNHQPAIPDVQKSIPSKALGSISVNPNPVVDKVIQIQFSKQPVGNYNIKLMNQLGQLVHNANIALGSTDMIKSIPVSGIVPGTYQLRITAPDGNETTLQVVIQ